MKAHGTVHRYGDNVDTDVIIPARYLNTADPAELAKNCMEDIDKDFVKRVKAGDIMVAGKNFGCGSSREHAPIAIKASGISCVIAESFARIFYRNSIKKTRLRLTSTQERLLMLQLVRHTRDRHSLHLCRISLLAEASSIR